jgi:chloramphenicol-sensitive protein RarD
MTNPQNRSLVIGHWSFGNSEGLVYGLAAYGFWGLMPIYFRLVATVPPLEVLAHRIVWCGALLLLLLRPLGRGPNLRECCQDRRALLLLGLSSLLIAVNWFAYIQGALSNRIVQASLGYFITPLVNVLLGMFFFRERLRRGQWLAVALAAGGMVYLVLALGVLPWIGLTLAVSFSFYGLVRKVTPVDPFIGLLMETLLLAPLSLAFLTWCQLEGSSRFQPQDGRMCGLLMLSGLLTAIPLLCFGQAARRLPLSVLGFLQYISPTIQFLLAVAVYGEPFLPAQRVCFALVWAALGVFTLDSLWNARSEGTRDER